jgi:hypothetical protein
VLIFQAKQTEKNHARATFFEEKERKKYESETWRREIEEKNENKKLLKEKKRDKKMKIDAHAKFFIATYK